MTGQTSFDVRFYKTDIYKGATTTTWWVRWSVGGERFKEPFKGSALADGFRSKLVTAAREGEAFDVVQGLPLSMLREAVSATPWFEFACAYVDMKWPNDAPGSRRTTADTLIPISMAMLRTQPSTREEAKAARKTMRLAFSTTARPAADELASLVKNSRKVGDLANPDVLRKLLSAVERKLDGDRAAYDTIRLRRITLNAALDYAVERKLLTTNPLDEIKTKKVVQMIHEVDERSVANPVQARGLLTAVKGISPRLVAFFALMYYAALRPEEAANLYKHNLSIPEQGWGEIYLEGAAPEIGEEWTDSGSRNEARSLKHREAGVGRKVPCCPELTAFLREHLDKHTGADGRLFSGRRSGGRLASSTYGYVWSQARKAAFTADAVASPLAKRPYDLRHACVSTWLNAGVEATRVAKWAGHSLAVLLRVYAKCLDGGEQTARKRVEQALSGREDFGTHSAQTPDDGR